MLRIAALATVVDASFEEWMQQFGKTYNGEDEMQKREKIFNDNMAFIEAENAKGNSYTLGWTPFTAMTHDEFKADYLGYSAPSELFEGAVNLGNHVNEEAADSVDWRKQGAVTPVKNQGQCGSCWSFSTTGGIEGAWEISTNQLVSLSEQQFVDCDKSSNGCGGGSMGSAFNWAKSQDLCTEQEYPYEAADGSCRANGCTGIAAGGVTGYKNVGLFGIMSATTAQLESAISQQPVSVAIEADQASFQHYTGGVMTGTCGTQLDHGVLAVGYDSESWLVKNSWGASWGENGYIRMTKDGNQCGILNQAAYPTVSSSVTV